MFDKTVRVISRGRFHKLRPVYPLYLRAVHRLHHGVQRLRRGGIIVVRAHQSAARTGLVVQPVVFRDMQSGFQEIIVLGKSGDDLFQLARNPLGASLVGNEPGFSVHVSMEGIEIERKIFGNDAIEESDPPLHADFSERKRGATDRCIGIGAQDSLCAVLVHIVIDALGGISVGGKIVDIEEHGRILVHGAPDFENFEVGLVEYFMISDFYTRVAIMLGVIIIYFFPYLLPVIDIVIEVVRISVHLQRRGNIAPGHVRENIVVAHVFYDLIQPSKIIIQRIFIYFVMVCFLIPVVNFVIVRHDLSRSTFVFSDGKVNTEGIGVQFIDSVPIAVIIFKERLNTARIILRDLFEQRRVDDFTKIRI